MPSVHALVHAVDRFTDRCGRVLAWLSLAMALTVALIVVLRYGFRVGSSPLQESVIYLHACLFLLGASYALKNGAHVRVDIFYRRFSRRGKAWIDSLGGIIFLLPLCTFIFLSSWDYVFESWSMFESSPEPGGIPAVYLLKSLIPLAAANLALQGVAEILRNALVLAGSSAR